MNLLAAVQATSQSTSFSPQKLLFEKEVVCPDGLTLIPEASHFHACLLELKGLLFLFGRHLTPSFLKIRLVLLEGLPNSLIFLRVIFLEELHPIRDKRIKEGIDFTNFVVLKGFSQ